MKKNPCRNLYDSCIEDETSSNSVVECSPIINDADVKSNQNEKEREVRQQRMTRSQAKRKLVQDSASLQEKKKRRSVDDNCKRGSKTLKQNNVKDDVEKESSPQYIITPSPAIFPPTTSRIDNVKDIAIDFNPYEEFSLQMNEKCQSTQSSGRRPELPSGVRSILCPYLKWCSLANSSYSGSDSKVQTRGMNASERRGSLFPCGCSFLYDDACGIINIESYLVSYLDEYIESLKENEFNIGQVSRTIFPLYLRTASGDEFRERMRKHDLRMFQRLLGVENNSSLSRCKESDKDHTSHPSTISTSSFARDRFRFYMDYFYRYERLDPKSSPVVTPNIRAVLVDWLIEVAAEYNLGSITLHTAVGLVDRCLASEKCELVKSSSSSDKWKKSSVNTGNGAFVKKKKCLVVSRKTIQLLGCGCMMIASKMHEVHPPDTKDFRYISASQYSISEITNIEKDICAALAFHLHIITPHHFANIYLRASYVSGNALNRPVCSMAYHDIGSKGQLVMNYLVVYLLEISMVHYDFSYLEPSKVAASAIYLARATLGIRDAEDPCDKYKQGYFSRTLKYYSGYDAEDLKVVVLKLHDMHKKAPSEVLKSVYEKYKKEKFSCIALKPPIDRDLLISSFNGFR